MCQFYETYNGPYLRYRSAVDSTKYLGFNKYGKPIKGQRGRQECFNFMKYNPSFSINDHNDWMTGNTPGDHHARRDLVLRKHQHHPHNNPQSHRAKKNSLQADESTLHRHRHSNRLKQHEDTLASPRRRHSSRLLLDVTKY